MKIVVIDDEPIILELLVDIIQEAEPLSEVKGFTDADEFYDYITHNSIDVAFLDIQMGVISGITLAKKIKCYDPKINIIFVTSYSEYMPTAFRLRASGYIMKPPTKENVLEELANLRNPVTKVENKRFSIKCFGNFEAFIDGKPIHFERTKTKELLAYLVDRNGSLVTSGEICAVLFEDSDPLKQKNYFRQLVRDLTNVLRETGLENIIAKSRNYYGIVKSEVSCDYFDFLANYPDGVRAFNGEYMSQYSWSESTLAALENGNY